jgi:hypothetical protein
MVDEISNIKLMSAIQIITWHYIIDIHHPFDLWRSINYDQMGG